MFGKTLGHEFLISYSHTEWYFLFPTVQLQVHTENSARCGRNTDALVNLNTKLNSAKLNLCQIFLPYVYWKVVLYSKYSLAPLTARSSSLRCVSAAEHQTAEQYFKTGRRKPRKHLSRSYLSWNTRQDFLKMPSLWEAALETERRCFSKVIFESNVTPKITRSSDSFSKVSIPYFTCFYTHACLLNLRLFLLLYFILAVPMRECLGKLSCMSSQFAAAILTSFSGSATTCAQETLETK